jgi:catechol 2,3-dioxygenase-like lactoylglutathione lyase family enzyme
LILISVGRALFQEFPVKDLTAIELRAHVPAKDFERSKAFYQDLGFTLCWSNDELAYLHVGPHGAEGKAGILLQNHYTKELAENLQMHLLVSDVEAWWKHVQDQQISEKYGITTDPPEDRDWKMRDFVLLDPAGVVWRIAQAIP